MVFMALVEYALILFTINLYDAKDIARKKSCLKEALEKADKESKGNSAWNQKEVRKNRKSLEQRHCFFYFSGCRNRRHRQGRSCKLNRPNQAFAREGLLQSFSLFVHKRSRHAGSRVVSPGILYVQLVLLDTLHLDLTLHG